MNIPEFVKMLYEGTDAEPVDGTKTKIAQGVYQIAKDTFRVNTHEVMDFIVTRGKEGVMTITTAKRP